MSSTEPSPNNDTSIVSLLQQSKARYTIRDKSSNKVLGYAIMNTDRSVSAEEVKFESITWPGAKVEPLEGPEADVSLPIPPTPHEVNVLRPDRLESDLDLSQDSSDSMNRTVEEDLSQSKCNEIEDSPGPIRPDKRTDIHQSACSSNTPSQPVLLDSSPCSAITPTNLSRLVSSPKSLPIPPTFNSLVSSPKSSVAPTPFHSEQSEKIKQEACNDMKTVTQSLASEIVINSKEQPTHRHAAGGLNEQPVSSEKRELEDDVDDHQKKKIAVDKRLERASRECLSNFYEYVEEGREKKYHRVKCLLCNNRRLLSLINFSRHVKAIHEPPVACENCGQMFSGEQLRTHRNRKKCAWQNLKFVEKPPSFSLDRSNKEEVDAVSSHPPMEEYQVESLDISDRSVGTIVREEDSDRTAQAEPGVTRGEIDQSSPATTSQDTQPSKSEGGEWVFITLVHHSLEKYRSNFKAEKHFKVKKLMKAFGKEHKIRYKKHLRFYIGSDELTGHEKIGELKLNRGKIEELKKNGGEIEVFGEIVDL